MCENTTIIYISAPNWQTKTTQSKQEVSKMINKKRVVLSVLCLLLLVFGVFSFSACKNEVENFNLSFKVNGETYQTITTSGDEATAIPENPTKEGYIFDGWYWDKDVWSKPFTANSLMDAPISSDMSVYAKFSAIKYDITYENDGGTHSNPVSYTIEDSFALSAAEKIGYTFVGWYSDAAYTTKVESVSAGSKGAITLYAKFEINNYTISYGNTMDAVNSNVTSYNVNTDTITLSDLSKTGYVFEGWYNGEKNVTEIAKGSTGDITLTAKWSVIGYEITYHNVDGATNSNSATYDVEDQPLALSDASKNGYRFLGWYTDAAFTNKVSEIAIGTTGDINLYAKWELIEYTATFMDGDTVIETIKFTVESEPITEPAVPNHVGYTGAWESYTLGTENITVNAVYTLISYGITYNNVSGATNNNPATYDVEDQPLALVDASKDYYTFLGWYSDAAFTNRVTEISVGTTGDVTLYAKWEAIEYTATFMDGTTVVGTVKFTVESESITEPTVPNHTGYTGAWESYTLGTENITVNAVYNLISYGITYNNVSGATNNNPATYDVEDQPLALVDASKDHYTFLGWYSDAAFTNRVTEISVGTTGTVELYAKWEAIEYTATFMDGTTVVATVKFTVESESITEPAVPNHTGYTGAWENYTLGTKDITINAVYSLVTYGITYNNVSGATNNNPTTYNVEDQPLALVDASKAHYTFLGWYSDAEFNNEVTEISVGTTGPVVLYAKWEAVEYTITFLYDNAIGDYAEGTVVKTTYTVEDEFEFAALVCKTVGYTFDGWFTEKNVGTGTKVTGVTKGTSGNITVYAQFGLEEYDITYNNVNGATNNNPTHYNATSEDFTIYPLTKEGYTFDGWFTNEECTTPANLTITKGSNGDITLYAKWTPITYTIEYVTYGGTATGNPKTYIITDNVTFNNATLSGYVFKGWYTAAEGGSKVTGITAGTTGNIILYAHWDYVSTITFESNGGSPVNSISNVEGTAISAPVAPTKEHYTFAGWYSDAALKNAYSFTTQPAEDITLYAKWTPVVYEIEYVLNGGTNSENNVVEYTVEDKIELYAPSKVGYTFIGWFTDAEFTSSVVTELKVGTSGKITLYAHYSVNQYTISFESNGGTSVSAITQNYATSVTAPEAPSKNGYTFAGWYSNASLTSKYTFSTMPAEDITLYAKWNLETYNITYNLNGGTNNSSNPATYTITSAKITLKAPTKTGYSFAGWYTDAKCTEAITEIASGSYGVVELFAKWTATEYTITYVTADGATHSNILTYTIETDLTTLADATLKGHAFGGWYTDDSYATAVTTVAGGEIGNKTIYAKFTANTYNVWLDGNEEASCVVSFNLNGAEGTIASQTVTPTATLKYPTVPTRAGYIFAGWYDNENCTGSLYDFTAVVTSDTTLYAKWVKVENATAIAINGSSNITLNGKYEQMLMFVPLVSGNITITASGSYDTFGVLYSSDMTALVQNDDGASDGSNFLIVYNVTAGETYYIGTRAFSSTTTGTATVSIAGSTTVLDGGYAITASKGSATYGQNFTLNVPNARDGYKFLGYADENGVMYTDATGASVKVWDKDADTTLYSAWERTVYTITFVTSGGTAIDSVELAYGERIDIGKYVTTRSGYSFNGWYLDGVEYNATTMPDHNITLTAYWKTFALGTIKYDIDKTAISVDDEITADLFSAVCLDTDGNLATFTVTVSGTQTAGEMISVRLVAKSGSKSKQITISDIKVYGDPTLTFDRDIDYFNIKDGLTANWFNASGTDSFGYASTVRVYVDYDYEAGDYVTITIESIDPAGNITYGYVDDVRAYGLPEITYNSNKNAISVNDTLKDSIFDATAVDSFGEALSVSVSCYSGTISAGNTVTIRLSAVDSKGNITNIDVMCKVYGMPIISDAAITDIKETDVITSELIGVTAVDSFGENLSVSISVKTGTQTAGTIVTITATAKDIVGNVATRDISIKVYGTPNISYEKDTLKVYEDATTVQEYTITFNTNGGSGSIANQTVSATNACQYPSTIPTRSGYAFTGWYTSSICTELYDFASDINRDIVLYAGWSPMVTSEYYSRNYINIYNRYNSDSAAYYISTSGTSETSSVYTYFTILTDGEYSINYKNGSSSTNYKTYLYIYNATQNTVIKSNSAISSTAYSSISFSAKAGDVIYVRNYRYSTTSTSHYTKFYMYVTGATLPVDGGISVGTSASKVLNAIATDSFGNKIGVRAEISSGALVGGNYVIYDLVATDHLGNVAVLRTDGIPVYDVNDIKIDFVEGMSDLIKLTSKGEEFNATATDSFGNLCDITIEAADGYTLSGGQRIMFHLIATDKAGNKVISEEIGTTDNLIKVYDVPTVMLNQDNLLITESTDVSFLFTVYDSFGEELYAEVSVTGEQTAGNTIVATVVATDDANNTVTKQYTFGVQHSEKLFVELYVNDQLWKTVFVDDPNEYILPLPNIENDFTTAGWFNSQSDRVTDETGVGLIKLTQNTKLYCDIYQADYTPIYSASQLKNIASAGKYILVANIDLNNAEWIPIGTKENPFTGEFNGNGYIISNFKINSSSTYVGLFGYNAGTIKNLGVEEFTINANAAYVGGLVGYNDNGIIMNCYTAGKITNSSTSSSSVGGLIGSNQNGTVINCYATGDVASSSDYSSNVGGLVGYHYGSSGGMLINCYATGDVSSFSNYPTSNGVWDAVSAAGGLVGDSAHSVIMNCFATGNVSSKYTRTDTNECAAGGGLIGSCGNAVTIVNCYKASDQTFTIINPTSTKYTGNSYGISTDSTNLRSKTWIEDNLWSAEIDIWNFVNGYPIIDYTFIKNADIIQISNKEQLLKLQGQALILNYDIVNNIDLNGIVWTPIAQLFGNFNGNGYTISNFEIDALEGYLGKYVGLFCYNRGTITNVITKNESVNVTVTYSQDYLYVGGLVSYNLGDIINCNAACDTIYASKYQTYVGGLVGYNNGIIKNSTATGDINTTSNSGSNYVGGLVGYNNYGKMENCYTTVAITVVNSSYSGGLVGCNSGRGIIINCYATGDVNTISVSGYTYSGGLVGYNSGAITNCYSTGNVGFTTTSGTVKAGGLIGSHHGIIMNCYAIGDICAISVSGSIQAGGLVGYNESSLSNCYATGDINVTSTTGSIYAGGLVGSNNSSHGTVINSYRYSGQIFTITLNETVSYDATNTLGIEMSMENLQSKEWIENNLWMSVEKIWDFSTDYPTFNYQTIEALTNNVVEISTKEELLKLQGGVLIGTYKLTADIDLDGIDWTPISFFGGIFDGNGHVISNFKITDSIRYSGLIGYNSGTIKHLGIEDFTITSCSSYAGGLVGYHAGSISDCYAIGVLTTSNSGYYSIYAGGLVGRNMYGTITNCSAAVTVTVSNSSSYSTYAGGLVGGNWLGTMSNCYATGNVISSDYAGGLLGSNDGTVINCYATGEVKARIAGGLVGKNGEIITNCYATGNVSSTSLYAGGLVALNDYGVITNCYATGNIIVNTTDTYNTLCTGGLVGKTTGGSITNCYRYSGQTFKITRKDTTTNRATNTDGTAIDMSSLKSSTFHINTIGWSDDYWNITEGAHPTLKK